mmetsp:Transcript_2998/g.4338  ORF Transcript_2998/g.4338 Transcript_2998/m.4338 type:complete len:141 (+) Transcript_2998:62-484(+)|eukprot:CAMPEP_0184478710 /NCGR_PEP_ID=MMETSP0113_2-20130426/665_1 /TAXON_ID=91329 /ORGANISM="Norrisiella sphaerica, Strain BC52" /LENGTH=140 /DNA_ID=CAMNT_0026856597 /DNA_START=64 /DNA_END=486 /DNA_ORIENTATION=+
MASHCSILAISQALNLVLVAFLMYSYASDSPVSSREEELRLGIAARTRASIAQPLTMVPAMRTPMGNMGVRPTYPAFDFGLTEMDLFETRDLSVDAVPKKRHSKQKKRHRKTLWKKKALKNAEKALVIARKIRDQADDEE